MNKKSPFQELIRVVERLRSPKGCPWDKKQTHRSLLKYLDEESEEFKIAVRKRDWANAEEELGDILLQVMLHAQIAKEKGRFTLDGVIRGLTRKMTLRHPHVFGYTAAHRKILKNRSLTLKTSQDVLDNWDLLKKISRNGSTSRNTKLTKR